MVKLFSAGPVICPRQVHGPVMRAAQRNARHRVVGPPHHVMRLQVRCLRAAFAVRHHRRAPTVVRLENVAAEPGLRRAVSPR